jgi:hypothetical protein
MKPSSRAPRRLIVQTRLTRTFSLDARVSVRQFHGLAGGVSFSDPVPRSTADARVIHRVQ